MSLSDLLFWEDHTPTAAFAAFMRDVRVPGSDVVSFDKTLQERFFQKNPQTGQPRERWELESVEVPCAPHVFHAHLGACGFIFARQPSNRYYLRAGWPGALAPRAIVRLQDLIRAWKSGVRWKETVVFGGKRPLDEKKEGFNECCALIGRPELRIEDWEYGRTWVQQKPQTELDMMKFVWEAIELPDELREAPVTFVDAPMKPPLAEGGQPIRPNTEDTVREWIHSGPVLPGGFLLSCGAPYGVAISEAFHLCFAEKLGMLGAGIDTFGHAAPALPPEVFMREVAGAVNRIRRARKL